MDPCSVYVHLPFCRSRCPYCDFASSEPEAIPFDEYTEALTAEWQSRAHALGGETAHTVYVGGGTPSLWPADRLAAILGLVGAKRAGEVTVEVNPGDAAPGWFGHLVGSGTTRFSIGVQSLDDARLRWLGRRHDSAQARAAVAMARTSGASSVGGDLIYGTPGQTVDGLLAEARELADLGVDHVSAYELTVAPGTKLGRMAATRDLALPDEDDMADLWRALGEAFAAYGFERYEVSNFARPGHRCRHNEHTWRGGAYVGLGAGAHGFLTAHGARRRYANSADVSSYIEAVRTNATSNPMGGLGRDVFFEDIAPECHARELVMLGLRTADGVDLAHALSLVPVSRRDAWTSEAESLVDRGLTVMVGTRLVPTLRGMLLADGLAERFF
ncbi:MAG: radical SAM family heme chaperone HemW [Deltaproteobacteria bacterium]|nr:radical SAM family heme chaperone HemW [Deltaproteobacteria bacterium]